MAKRKATRNGTTLGDIPDFSSAFPDFAFPNLEAWDRAMEEMFKGLDMLGAGIPELKLPEFEFPEFTLP